MSELIYCATPSRIVHKMEEIMDFVTNKGLAPFHPFQAFPYERFEGNPKIGRDKSMEFCMRSIDICDQFWMFGVSKGTLQELVYALNTNKTSEAFLDEFDPDWKIHYTKLQQKYAFPLKKI